MSNLVFTAQPQSVTVAFSHRHSGSNRDGRCWDGLCLSASGKLEFHGSIFLATILAIRGESKGELSSATSELSAVQLRHLVLLLITNLV